MLNTGATFLRMGVTVWMGLVTARLLLTGLGQDAFGGYAVLFAAGSLSAIIGDSLWNSTMTRLALELGRDDRARLREVFNTAVAMFCVASVLTLVAGIVLSGWIPSLVNLPASIGDGARWPFRLIVLSFAIAMLGTPFKALLQAHQELTRQAIVDTVDSIGRLAIALAIFLIGSGRLLWLCALLALHAAVIALLVAGLAATHHPEARPDLRCCRRDALRRLVGFGGWDVLATGSWRIRLQGSQLLIGAAFAPAVSAAYALAVYVGMLQLNFATALYRAVQPAILTAEGRGDHLAVSRLVLVSGKYMVLGMLLLLVPTMLEADSLLALWLGAGRVPAETALFTRLTIAWIAVYYLSVGYQMAAQGSEIYPAYALWLFAVDALTVGIAAVAVLVGGAAAWTIPAIVLAMSVVLAAGRAVLVGRAIGLPVQAWLRHCVLPILTTLSVTVPLCFLTQQTMEPGVSRLILVCGLYPALALPVIWLFGVEDWERAHIRRVATSVAGRLRAFGRRLAPASARS